MNSAPTTTDQAAAISAAAAAPKRVGNNDLLFAGAPCKVHLVNSTPTTTTKESAMTFEVIHTTSRGEVVTRRVNGRTASFAVRQVVGWSADQIAEGQARYEVHDASVSDDAAKLNYTDRKGISHMVTATLLTAAEVEARSQAPQTGRGGVEWVADDGGRSQWRKGEAPDQADAAGDCVVRALAIFSGKAYSEVRDLIENAIEFHGLRNDIDRLGTPDVAWRMVAAALGFEVTKLPKRMTVKAVVADHPDCVLATGGHLQAVVDGVVRDTWDSTNKRVAAIVTRR